MISVLIGKDLFLLNQEIDQISKDILERGLTFETETFEGSSSSFDLSDFFHATRTLSFLNDTKLIILNAYDGLSATGKLLKEEEREFELLIQEQSQVNVIIISNERLDSRKKIVKLFQTQTKIIDLIKPNDERLLLANLLKNYKVEMSKETAEYFLKVIDHKPERMNSEIQKLSLYNQQIKTEDIDILVNASSDFLFYASELADALMKQQKIKLFEIYQELLLQRKKPIEIISTVAKSIRQVYQFNVLYQRGERIEEIAGEIGISSKQGYRYKSIHLYRDLHPLLKYLNDLSELDQKFKSGRIDQTLGFELFLIKAVDQWNH